MMRVMVRSRGVLSGVYAGVLFLKLVVICCYFFSICAFAHSCICGLCGRDQVDAQKPMAAANKGSPVSSHAWAPTVASKPLVYGP